MQEPYDTLKSRDFAPLEVERHGDASGVGDQRSGDLYVYSEKLKLAVRVALVTGRPLLVRGPPGWGKSSLAHAVAKHKKWRYLEKVISSRTQARDLMSELDLVRRLSDAQSETGVDPNWRRYIRPGVLWQAFDPAGAELQRRYFDRRETEEASAAGAGQGAPAVPAVVLLDEMDKADPDVPNNLLVALGSLQFTVDEIGDAAGSKTVKAAPEMVPLIIVTTNDERDLPRAFLRRCVEIELPTLDGPDADGTQRTKLLVKIGVEHLRNVKDTAGLPLDQAFVEKIAKIVVAPPNEAPGNDGLIIPSPAEFIDTARAVGALHGADAKKEDIAAIIGIAVRKRGVGGSL
jgi:MoxR-like ATPase